MQCMRWDFSEGLSEKHCFARQNVAKRNEYQPDARENL